MQRHPLSRLGWNVVGSRVRLMVADCRVRLSRYLRTKFRNTQLRRRSRSSHSIYPPQEGLLVTKARGWHYRGVVIVVDLFEVGGGGMDSARTSPQRTPPDLSRNHSR